MDKGHRMRPYALLVLLGALLLPAIAACARETKAPAKLTVAAASSTRFALPEIIGEFEKANEGVSVKVVYGASGSLAAQVASKAPFDIFLSADENNAIELVKARHGVGGSIVRYATGRLVLWAPSDSPLDVSSGLQALLHESVRKIAIANPSLAPYGVAAEEALKSAGVYESVKDRLVLGDSIAQTAQFVESGSAQAGLIALSIVEAPGMKDKGRTWIVPESTHAPIIHSACISAYARETPLAERFMTFLASETARTILRRHGFGIPGE